MKKKRTEYEIGVKFLARKVGLPFDKDGVLLSINAMRGNRFGIRSEMEALLKVRSTVWSKLDVVEARLRKSKTGKRKILPCVQKELTSLQTQSVMLTRNIQTLMTLLT
jgi:hypothetical protein